MSDGRILLRGTAGSPGRASGALFVARERSAREAAGGGPGAGRGAAGRGGAGTRLEGRVEPSIVVARELSPAELLSVEPQVLLGLVTELGGPTAHLAIVARELGIPAVLGAAGAVEAAERNQAAEVDGGS